MGAKRSVNKDAMFDRVFNRRSDDPNASVKTGPNKWEQRRLQARAAHLAASIPAPRRPKDPVHHVLDWDHRPGIRLSAAQAEIEERLGERHRKQEQFTIDADRMSNKRAASMSTPLGRDLPLARLIPNQAVTKRTMSGSARRVYFSVGFDLMPSNAYGVGYARKPVKPKDEKPAKAVQPKADSEWRRYEDPEPLVLTLADLCAA